MKKRGKSPLRKLKRKKVVTRRSGVWAYFTDVFNDSSHRLVRCHICDKILHNNQTCNLHRHLGVHRIMVAKCALKPNRRRDVPVISNIKVRKSPRNLPPPEPSTPVEPKTILFEPKSEPEVIFDDDQDVNRISLDLMTPSESREQSPLLVPLETTSECAGTNLNTFSVEEAQQPESSSFIDSSQSATTYINAVANVEKHGHNLDLNATLTDICAEVKYIKSHIFSDSDTFFYKSVAEELDNMPEDSKDFVKAAVWQIIYKVKNAKRKNVELSVSDLIK